MFADLLEAARISGHVEFESSVQNRWSHERSREPLGIAPYRGMAQIQGDVALSDVYVVGVPSTVPPDLFALPEMKYKPRSSVPSCGGQFAGTVPGKIHRKLMNVPVAEPLFPPAQAEGAVTNTAPATPTLAARHAILIDREIKEYLLLIQ